MENISNVLFWISNGLLVPVIVGLLYFFIRALFLLGGVYGEYLERKKTERDLNEKLENMAEEEVYGFRTDLGKMQPTPFVFTARKLLADGMTSIHRDRLWDRPWWDFPPGMWHRWLIICRLLLQLLLSDYFRVG